MPDFKLLKTPMPPRPKPTGLMAPEIPWDEATKAWNAKFNEKLLVLCRTLDVPAIAGQPDWEKLALALIAKHEPGFRSRITGRQRSVSTAEGGKAGLELLRLIEEEKAARKKRSLPVSDWDAWCELRKPQNAGRLPQFYRGDRASMKKGTLKEHLARSRAKLKRRALRDLQDEKL